MAKSRSKAKGIVHLRERKLADGSVSLWLDVISGGKRWSKTLGLKVQKPKSPFERKENEKIYQLAETARAKYQLQLQHQGFGEQDPDRSNQSFFDYFDKLIDQRKDSEGNYGNWKSVKKHFEKYAQHDVTFMEVDRLFVLGFKEYLISKAKTKSQQRLSTNSQASYFNKFKAALKCAVSDGIIVQNPAANIAGIKSETPERQYLDVGELRKMASAECKYPVLKRAFLFSSLTGLRWSDVQKLTWKEVLIMDGKPRIVFRQKKTRTIEYLPIGQQAFNLLGKRSEDNKRVFEGLKYSTHHNLELLRWAMRAGISKHITFHSARHTFATMQLSIGTDIYTVSNLLGHSELRTTQVYAKVIDAKKESAMNSFPEIDIDKIS